MSKGLLKIFGLVTTLGGIVVSVLSDYVTEQKINERIDKKVDEELDKRNLLEDKGS